MTETGEVDACVAALVAARAGDARAFAVLVQRHQRTVYSLALRMLRRPDLAEDLAQDVFLQLYRKLTDIESPSHLGYWLRRVTSNLAIDRLRSAPARAAVPLEEHLEPAALDAATENADPAFGREVLRVLDDLPPAPRAVMLLRYQEDCDVADIAATLDMPLNTVKSHLKRSLTALRAKLLGVQRIDCEELT
jgi:RNA polymerase sigma-70 factor (ECF subfamily)